MFDLGANATILGPVVRELRQRRSPAVMMKDVQDRVRGAGVSAVAVT
jgi:hypothetical protein